MILSELPDSARTTTMSCYKIAESEETGAVRIEEHQKTSVVLRLLFFLHTVIEGSEEWWWLSRLYKQDCW